MSVVVVAVGLVVAAVPAAPVASESAALPSGGRGHGRLLGATVHDPPTPVPGTDKRRHLVYP